MQTAAGQASIEKSSAPVGDDTSSVTSRWNALVPPARTVADAADAFLARATAPTTRRSYGQTMSALTAAYGDRPLEVLDGPAVAERTADTWERCAGHLEPTHRHAALVQRLLPPHRLAAGRPLCRPGAAPGADRPHQGRRRHLLERLFRREDVPVREKCLWRLLYETPARRTSSPSTSRTSTWTTSAPARSPKAVTPSGCISSPAPPACYPASSPDARPAHCSSPIAAPHPPATVDVCPVTGKGRLSYERTEYLFKRHPQRISRNGLTLQELRHSALTTLVDADGPMPLLMGKSRHKNLRSLQRYVTPPPRPSLR